MNKLLKDAIVYNNQDYMRYLSKFIALSVRNQLEDLHSNGAAMDDTTMPEINTSIRNGIYNAIYALTNASDNIETLQYTSMTFSMIPDCWEEPQLDLFLEKHFLNIQSTEIKFDSSFLNEQLKINNICRLPNTLFVRPNLDHDGIQISSDQRKKLLNKITAQLKKEGYIYDSCSDAYSKPLKLPLA